MAKNTFLTALLVVMAVLCAEAQNNKVWKTDTVIDGKGNKIITVYKQNNVAEGNGNIVTRDIDVAAFKEISMILPATGQLLLPRDPRREPFRVGRHLSER